MSLGKMSMAQEFPFLRDLPCRINVGFRPSSTTTFGWPEGHGLGSSVDDGEMNGVTNFTSSNGSLLG